MLLNRFLRPARRQVCAAETLPLAGRALPLLLVRDRKARRYILRLLPDGTARVTMPWRGTLQEARGMVQRHADWLEVQFRKLNAVHIEPDWAEGTQVLFHGERLPLRVINQENGSAQVTLGNYAFALRAPRDGSLRSTVEARLWALAKRELPPRVLELAAAHGFALSRVTVRNQKSRWGSCSRRGTISLNWRLIQAPAFVRDYIILHELAHLRHMNHSASFWREVARICPSFEEAERWLKANKQLLR